MDEPSIYARSVAELPGDANVRQLYGEFGDPPSLHTSGTRSPSSPNFNDDLPVTRSFNAGEPDPLDALQSPANASDTEGSRSYGDHLRGK